MKYIEDLKAQIIRVKNTLNNCILFPVVGMTHEPVPPGIYQVNAPDTYAGLTLKVKLAFEQVMKCFNPSVIIKVDDDIMLNDQLIGVIRQVVPLTTPCSYIGGGRGDTRKMSATDGRNGISSYIHRTRYVYGGVTIYGSRAANLIANNNDMRCQLEDVTAGHVLTTQGVIPCSFGFRVKERPRKK